MYRTLIRVAQLCSGHSFHTFKAILEGGGKPFMPNLVQKGESTTPYFINSVGEFLVCHRSHMGTGVTMEITWYQSAFRKQGFTEYAAMLALQGSTTLIELFCNLLLVYVSVVCRLSTMVDKEQMRELFTEHGSASIQCALKELIQCATGGRLFFQRMTRHL
ncbi:hypothetical protein PENTCL1PPCAC_27283, partial [Pristionchus entomophagus]